MTHLISPHLNSQVMSVAEFDEFTRNFPTLKRMWVRFQFRLRLLVSHNMFNQFFLVAILVNTVLLALEYDGECAWNAGQVSVPPVTYSFSGS